jgi:isocitrate dehydrogenase kinase/phosphatase
MAKSSASCNHDQLGAAIGELYRKLHACIGDDERLAVTARLILAIFDEFYAELCEYPYRAKRAFEAMDPQASIRFSKERLVLWSEYILEHGPRIRAAFPELASNKALWDEFDRLFLPLIEYRYEADIAFSFALSTRRNIFRSEWQPVGYSFPPPCEQRAMSLANAHRRLPIKGRINTELIIEALRVTGFSAPFRDEAGDAERIADRVNKLLAAGEYGSLEPVALDIVEAGFFRDVSAFVVGRWVGADGRFAPFVVALLNSPAGIYADAVLHTCADVHNLFSSTLANFHVTSKLYYQICVFLHSIMPDRPLGLHYSTIGFNHVGKVAVLNEIDEQMAQSGQTFQVSPGFAGTVAIGFTFPSSTYHLKVIRDRPTKSYKWGEFVGIESVLSKYKNVHEINRTGSMLDNIMYYNLKLRRDMFDPNFLEYLCEHASSTVQVKGGDVLIKHLIVQLKVTPLPVYLEVATESEMETVIINLGHCIKNNMSANIFNKDLDSRNYGVGRYGKVFLFDYDAVEKFTDVKIRTNLDREEGEEDIPGWFFEEGVVFLPEEMEHGLQFTNRAARLFFRRVNADLMSLQFWEDMQNKLRRGEVVPLRIYPESRRLHHEIEALL